MHVHKLPVPAPVKCESCGELPARIRLVIDGFSEKLCVLCIGVMSLEVSAILDKLNTEIGTEDFHE